MHTLDYIENLGFEGMAAGTDFDPTAQIIASGLASWPRRPDRRIGRNVAVSGPVVSAILNKHAGIAYADIARCIELKQFHDVVGYYNRFDIFRLDIDRTPREPATFVEETASARPIKTATITAGNGDAFGRRVDAGIRFSDYVAGIAADKI